MERGAGNKRTITRDGYIRGIILFSRWLLLLRKSYGLIVGLESSRAFSGLVFGLVGVSHVSLYHEFRAL